MSANGTKSVVSRYYDEVWVKRDPSAMERFVDPGAMFHLYVGGESSGPAASQVRDIFAQLERAAPDAQITIDDILEDGDEVAVQFTIKGTHTGEFQSLPPTHQPFELAVVSFERVANGKIAETWQAIDIMNALQQVGVFPSGPPPRVFRWIVAMKGRRNARKERRAGAPATTQ